MAALSARGLVRVRAIQPSGAISSARALTESGNCACGTYIMGCGSLLRPPSRTSATTPMICRSGSSANSCMTPRPITIRAMSGSSSGQYWSAIVSLITTTGGAPLPSRSVKTRPRRVAIRNTSKKPSDTVVHPPPPWNGPSSSGRRR